MHDNDPVRLAEEINAYERILSALETDAAIDRNVVEFVSGVLATRRAALEALQRRSAMRSRLTHVTAALRRASWSARDEQPPV